ncbi:glycosyltransferase family 2 protein [Galbibacter mesophilus]|uniref:glycosyltransferase family 2 protein n=1 Tax=Galbibacter mesophilus TaxID=379069 RepID=UPI00191F5075|nr:glycosyltransferase family 2 protein [Galbibacter mesophilus]MCM5663488.1 glycosyltransferase family 2 protein [Galbibacter mesophilus]
MYDVNPYPNVCVLIVNFCSWKNTIECIESLYNMEYSELTIFIIDNSPDEISVNNIVLWAENKIDVKDTQFPGLMRNEKIPIEYLVINEDDFSLDNLKDLNIVKAKENNGFAAANNILINKLVGQDKFDFCWLLNNDTVVSEECLHNLINVATSDQNEIVGSILYDYNSSSDIIQSIGGFYNPYLGMVRINKSLDRSPFVDYPIGASILISKKFINTVGGMCEDYFLFLEEYDWILRAKENDFSFSLDLHSKIYHKGGSTIVSTSKFSDFYGIRSKILFNKKFFKQSLLFFYIFFGFGYIVNRVRRAQYDRIYMYFKLLRKPLSKYNA